MANPHLVNGVASPQSIYEIVTGTPKHKVGTRGLMEDGRVFYYTRNGTTSALSPGKIMVKADVLTNHHECDVTTGAAGSFTVSGITIGATALTANQYKDGWLVVTDGAGEGHTYKIKNHAAALASATDVAVTLYDPIAVALDTNSTVSFILNDYADPQISVTDQLDIPVGVPAVSITAAASATDSTTWTYGWMQTWGTCGLLQDETIAALAQVLTVGTGVAGAAEEDDTATTVSQETVVGINITAAVDTEYSPVFLMIRP